MTEKEQKEIFSKNLTYYINASGKRQIDVCNDLNINKTTLNMWCNANSMPRVGKIQLLADYFGILKSDLVDENDHSNNDKIGELNKEEKEVILKLRQADEKTKAIVYFALNITEG